MAPQSGSYNGCHNGVSHSYTETHNEGWGFCRLQQPLKEMEGWGIVKEMSWLTSHTMPQEKLAPQRNPTQTFRIKSHWSYLLSHRVTV